MRPHGATRYKTDGCRCDLCRAAVRREFRQRYRAKAMGTFKPTYIDATGTKRRLQALMALGYSTTVIGEGLGTDRRNVLRLLSKPKVAQQTADKVAAVYDELWNRPVPLTCHTSRLRASAKANGYLPPMAWDDDSIDDPLAEPWQEAAVGVDWQIVERAVTGKPRGRRLTSAEREAAMQVMAQRGATATGISRALGVHSADAKRVAQIGGAA